MLKIMKFGGSIIASPADFKRLVEIVKAKQKKKESLVIVASAMQGVTDEIINACSLALQNSSSIKDFIDFERKKHVSLLADIQDKELYQRAVKKIDSKLETLEKALFGISFLKELSERSCAMLYPTGEQLSVLLIEAFLNDSGFKAIAFDADKTGIVTNSCFSEAIPLMEKTTKNLKEKILPLLKDTVPIITGYFAADEEGNPTCFGRGGSDFSAGIIANALEADCLELWKDVDGFMSADPKIVPKASLIKELSYEEAEELGYFGAKILHPRTIAPLRQKNIPAIVKNVFNPQIEGTIISSKKSKTENIIKSIAFKKNLAVITINSPEFVGQVGIIKKVFSPIADAEIPIDMVATGETAVSFTIAEKDLEKAKKAAEKILIGIEKISFESGKAMIGIVGEGMKRVPGIVGKICTCLGENNINIEMISQGANEINISLIIKQENLEKAIKAVHEKFWEKH